MKIFPEDISTYGHEIDNLFWLTTAFAAIAFFISLYVLFYPIFKNHYKKIPRAVYFTGEKRKHFRWVVIALVLLAMSDFVILLVEHGTWVKTQQEIPAADFEVAIIGRQWNWVFQYPGPDGKLYTADDVTLDQQDSELHVPVGKNVNIHIKARDVIHGLFIPTARFKYDAIPGRTTIRWFNATKEGKYDIVCSEICGVLHTRMRNFLVVESQESLNKYLSALYHPQADQTFASNKP